MTASSFDVGPMAVIIMGVSGSGKSTLAQELSAATALPFLEGDEFHTADAIAKMTAGSPLSDQDRWPWLDRLGQAIAANVASHGFAIATCSALKRMYRDRLRLIIAVPVKFVQLEGERDMLARRMTSRPGHYMPPSLLSSQLNTLEPLGPDEDALRLDARLPPAILRDAVLHWLRPA